jgi:hypothetical protein
MAAKDCKASATESHGVKYREVRWVTAFSATDLANIVGLPTWLDAAPDGAASK